MVETVRQPPAPHGVARARRRRADLRATLPWLAGYSPSGGGRALRRLKVSRQRGRPAVHRPDPADAAKLARVGRARAPAGRPDGGVAVLYGDGFSLRRRPTLAAAYAPRRQAPAARLSRRANTRHRIGGAPDLAAGRATWLARSKMGVANLKRFLAKLRRAYPASRRLILAWDDWPVHRNPAAPEAASALGLELLRLPTCAPWPNPIEELWRRLRQDLLRHHRKADQRKELQAEVFAWLDRFAGPAPARLRYVGLLPD